MKLLTNKQLEELTWKIRNEEKARIAQAITNYNFLGVTVKEYEATPVGAWVSAEKLAHAIRDQIIKLICLT